MAYENYSQVSWTDGTPITGDRLQQVSTNIQQVKEATDDSPQGIKKIKTITSNSNSFNNFSTSNLIVSLENESGTGGPDNRVTISASRYYRVTISFPGFVVDEKGAEDAKYILKIANGTFGSANTTLYKAIFTPPVFIFSNVSLGANSATVAFKNAAYDTFFGAGTHSVVLSSNISGANSQTFFATVEREQGASATNSPAFYVPAASASHVLQLYVEDIGGIA
jgi:hypothetical protein